MALATRQGQRRLRCEFVDPTIEQPLQGVGQLEGVERLNRDREATGSVAHEHAPPLDQRHQQLLGEQWMTRRPLVDEGGQDCRQAIDAERHRAERRHGLLVELGEFDVRPMVGPGMLTGPSHPVVRAAFGDDEQRRIELAHRSAIQQPRGCVGPLDVLEHHRQRRASGGSVEEAQHGVLDQPSTAFGAQFIEVPIGVARSDGDQHRSSHPRIGAEGSSRRGDHLVATDRAGAEAQARGNDRTPQPIWGRSLDGTRPSTQNTGSAGTIAPGEVGEKQANNGRLAHPRLAADDHERCGSRRRRGGRLGEHGALASATHQAVQRHLSAILQPTDRFVDRHWLRDALERHELDMRRRDGTVQCSDRLVIHRDGGCAVSRH